MLAALETGVKGGKWFSLMDKVYAPSNLHAAWTRVRDNAGAAGVDQQTVDMFEQHLAANLADLSQGLRDGSYRPAAVRRVLIPKLGTREMRPLAFRRYVTASCKRRCATYWNRFSSEGSQRTVTDFARDAEPKTRGVGWTNCSRPDKSGS
jgi:hypothetical protein